MLALADDVISRCRELAAISEDTGRLTRPFATPAMARANTLVGGWMTGVGMEVRTDAAGNLVGHLPGTDPAAGTLLLGSHLDTVRDAGAFDGALGVVIAIACLEMLRDEGRRLPYAVDVLGFCDAEGLRFDTIHLGSRAVAGTLDEGILALTDRDGITLGAALRSFGGLPDALADAGRLGERLLGYCEVHIEQGPVLEQLEVPVAVVTGIAGATRGEIRFTGRAGHAATVPMHDRHDAVCAVAEWVLAVEEVARSTTGLVATVGRLEALPGAANVVPGAAVASLDVRHADDGARAAAVSELRDEADAIAAARGLQATWSPLIDTAAVETDHELSARLARAITERGLPDVRLASTAGHDAVALAGLAPAAMLFVRCAGGVSHHPDESVDAADVAVAIEVLLSLLSALV